MEFFKDNSLNYSNIPNDCRSNSILENYNKYIKSKLGNHRIINWINFLSFIKDESVRSIKKLLHHANKNVNYTIKIDSNKINTNTNCNNLNQNNINIPYNLINNENKNILDLVETKNNINELNINFNQNTNIGGINVVLNSLIGFNNLGNTCYLNSGLQIILHCKLFLEEIILFQFHILFLHLMKLMSTSL